MQKDIAYFSGSIITLLFLFIIAYHAYTEIVIKNKVWIYFKKAIIKQRARIQEAVAINCAVSLLEPSSYTTTVVEAPRDEPRSNRSSIVDETNLREPLLESADGTTSL